RANQAAPMRSHEINCFRGYFLSCHDQVAFVFAVGIVRHDDNATLGDVAYHIVNCIELKRLTRLGNHSDNTNTSVARLINSCSCLWCGWPVRTRLGLHSGSKRKMLVQPGGS